MLETLQSQYEILYSPPLKRFTQDLVHCAKYIL